MMKRNVIFILLFIGVASMFATFYYYNSYERSEQQARKPLNFVEQTPSKEIVEHEKRISFWTIPFHDPTIVEEFLFEDYHLNYIKEKNDYPPYTVKVDSPICGRCEIVYDRAMYNKSDAVIFHPKDIKKNDLPKTRGPEQLFVWWLAESSFSYRGPITNYYNLTMSVRRSSDVHNPYSSFPWLLRLLWNKRRGNDKLLSMAQLKGINPISESQLNALLETGSSNVKTTVYDVASIFDVTLRNLISRKDKMSAWIVSNCGGLRRNYFDQMATAGFKTDTFGGCFNNRFPISRWDPKFFDYISTYKFYLSFENSFHCIDYMTEKLWFTALYSGTVPIIFGPSPDDVAEVLPPKSYIHVENFKTVDELVQYLNYLDKNVTAYSEYLMWTTWDKYLNHNGLFDSRNGTIQQRLSLLDDDQRLLVNKYLPMKPIGFCGLCHRLHHPTTKTIPDKKSWWINEERPECLDTNRAKQILKL